MGMLLEFTVENPVACSMQPFAGVLVTGDAFFQADHVINQISCLLTFNRTRSMFRISIGLPLTPRHNVFAMRCL